MSQLYTPEISFTTDLCRAIIGSSLGGGLADPVRNYPSFFSRGTIFEEFPFLLPNMICAGVCMFSFTVALLFLEETNERAKHRRDVGLDIGRWIIGTLKRSGSTKSQSKLPEGREDEDTALIWEDEKPEGYNIGRASAPPSKAPSGTETPRLAASETDSTSPDLSTARAFNRQVVLNIVCYGLVA